MIRSLNDLKGYKFRARDGDMGRIQDFYFDDATWTVRYLVLETGEWLPGRRVLVAPEAIESTDWQAHHAQLNLDLETIEKSPRAESKEPVSRQHLTELHDYYGWNAYWNAGPAAMEATVPIPMVDGDQESSDEHDDADVHLRSVDEVVGYSIAARDGSIGEIADFGAEEDTWAIRYLVVDTRKWLPGKRVLVSPDWVDRLDWGKAAVFVDLEKDQIKNSPPFDPNQPMSRVYEEVLYDFYGRPRYWESARANREES